MPKRLPTNMIYSMQARAVVDDQWLQAEAAREGNRWHLRLRDVPGQRVIMTRTLPAMTSTQAMQTMLDWLMGGGETENDDDG